MTPIVLASSPLVGSAALADTATALRGDGRRVALPDVPGDLDAFVGSVSGVVTPDAVLVGFSAAGPRLFAVAERTRPAAIVFLDARLPADGVAPDAEPRFADLLDRLPRDDADTLPPWPDWWPDEVVRDLVPDDDRRALLLASSPRLPREMFSTPIPAPDYDGPCAFIALGDGYADDAADAERRGWPTVVLDDADHLWPLTHPEAVATVIGGVVRRLVP